MSIVLGGLLFGWGVCRLMGLRNLAGCFGWAFVGALFIVAVLS